MDEGIYNYTFYLPFCSLVNFTLQRYTYCFERQNYLGKIYTRNAQLIYFVHDLTSKILKIEGLLDLLHSFRFLLFFQFLVKSHIEAAKHASLTIPAMSFFPLA